MRNSTKRKKRYKKPKTRKIRWADEELKVLDRFYATIPNRDLSKKLGRSIKSIVGMAHRRGLKKHPALFSMLARENVNKRYE